MISRDSKDLVADLVGGFGLLTRIPLPLNAAPRPDACWGWPVVGLAVAAIAAGVGGVAIVCGVPAGPAAALVLVVQALLTGGLHEDGLADTAVLPHAADKFLAAHKGKQQAWITDMDHSFNATQGPEMLDRLLDATAAFFKQNGLA